MRYIGKVDPDGEVLWLLKGDPPPPFGEPDTAITLCNILLHHAGLETIRLPQDEVADALWACCLEIDDSDGKAIEVNDGPWCNIHVSLTTLHSESWTRLCLRNPDLGLVPCSRDPQSFQVRYGGIRKLQSQGVDVSF